MIVLRAKTVDFQVTYIDLSDKPDWFLEISPHGKVPVLVVDGTPLFESNAIAEFLEETVDPPLHPRDPVQRARNRAWTDFVPTFSEDVYDLFWCESEAELPGAPRGAPGGASPSWRRRSPAERDNDGPFFNGDAISLVDAAYAPFLHRLAIVEEKAKTGVLDGFPLVSAWTDALVGRRRASRNPCTRASGTDSSATSCPAAATRAHSSPRPRSSP